MMHLIGARVCMCQFFTLVWYLLLVEEQEQGLVICQVQLRFYLCLKFMEGCFPSDQVSALSILQYSVFFFFKLFVWRKEERGLLMSRCLESNLIRMQRKQFFFFNGSEFHSSELPIGWQKLRWTEAKTLNLVPDCSPLQFKFDMCLLVFNLSLLE